MAIQLISGDQCKIVAGGAKSGELISTLIDDGIEVTGEVLSTTKLGLLIPAGLKVVGAVVGSKVFKDIFTALHL